MKIKYNKKEYIVAGSYCKKFDCFLPFSGNGLNICRLYELGQCKYDENIQKIRRKAKNI